MKLGTLISASLFFLYGHLCQASASPFESFMGTYEISTASCLGEPSGVACPDTRIEVYRLPFAHEIWVNDRKLTEGKSSGGHTSESAMIGGVSPNEATWRYTYRNDVGYSQDIEISFTRKSNGEIYYDDSIIENDRQSKRYQSRQRHYTLKKIVP